MISDDRVSGDDALDGLSFLHRPVAPAFRRSTIALAPGASRPYDSDEWRGALVVVEQGEIELRCLRGAAGRFEAGAVLWLVGLPLRALHNPGSQPTVLVAVSRRPRRPDSDDTDEFSDGSRFHAVIPHHQEMAT